MYGIYDKGGVLEWSISSDRSCHIGPNRTSNCFDLNYPEDALYILILYQKDGQSNLFLDSIEAQRADSFTDDSIATPLCNLYLSEDGRLIALPPQWSPSMRYPCIPSGWPRSTEQVWPSPVGMYY
ncbi:hypothetical protein WN943_029497 [Citrus x changshan-huyou]